MSETYTYRTMSRWTGDRSGKICGEGVAAELPFSAPPEFHGEKGKWSPELFLAGAAGACFLTTFVALAGFSRLELEGVEVGSEARLQRVPREGYQFTQVVLRPVVTLKHERDRNKAKRLLEKAEKSCFVGRALQLGLSVEAGIRIGGAAQAA